MIYEKGTQFNMDYYLKTHMPLVQEKWAEHGLKSWKVWLPRESRKSKSWAAELT